jgi:PKD repeat protein
VNWGVGKTANDFDVQPTVSLYGDYTFTWTIQNGPVLSGCNTSDNVQIHFAEEADAGPEQYRCATLTVTLAGNDPSTGTGTWTYTGPGNVLNWGAGKTANDFDAQPTVSLYGDYTFTWTIQNGPVLSGCSTSDNVQIHFAEQAEAGPEQFICATLTAASFSANDPSTGTGTWTYTGPGSVVNWGVGKTANDFDVQPTVSLYGDYTFTWTIQNGPVLSGCNTSDNVQIHFAEEADAGSEQFICAMRTVTLAGNKPSAGTGTWSYTGPGVVSNWGIGKTPADFDAQPTVSLYGDYTFTWTIQNGPVLSGCSTSDDVQIHFAEQAEAGPEQFICATLTAASFNANVPSTGSGSWTYSGPGNVVDWGTNKDEYDFDITPTVSAYGNYTFTWTIQNGPTMGGCSTSNDVLIHFAEHADAGNDQHVDCNLLTTTLAGNNPSAGIGTWSLTGVNPGNITGWGSTNANTFNGTPVVSAYGTYTFRWTIVNGPVPGNGCSTYDDVEITFYPEHTVATIADFSVCRDSSLTPISITGSFGGGALSASWSVTTGNGYVQNESIAGNTVTAEYVPVYSDITAGGVVLTLTTNSPAVNETCSAVSDNLNVTIDEAVYVVIDQAPLLIIAEGTSAVITATISGARGTVTTGTWTEQGALTGGDFSPGITSNNITFTPTPAQEAAGSVVLRLTSANPGTTCSPAFAEITILIGANPVADAGPDIETCEPADSLLHLSGYAKASANDANWSVLPGGFGTIISQTKTWSSPQSTPHDENDSLLVEAVYRLHPSDYGTPSTGSSFGFRLTTDDPDGAGPVSDDYDDMTYTVHWSPKTPPVGGGGRTVTCVNSMGNYYAVPLNTGNTYAWEIEVLTGNGVPGTDYLVAQGGTGYNYIVIHWYNEGTYNLKVTETTYLTDGTPCVGETVIQPIGVYSQPLVTAGRDTTLCIGGSAGLSSSVTGGSGSYLYEWSPSIGLSAFNIPNPVVTGTYLGDVVYTVKVTDLISGCQSSTATVTITTVPLPDIFTLSGNAFYCYGSAEGATLTLSGSETNVLYQLMNGATAVGTPRSGTGDTLQWKNNFDGSYFVEAVRNATPACERTMAGIVNITANPEIVMTVNQIVNTNCYGSDEGRISISVTGGTAPYTYLWSGPASFSSTNEDISSLYAGDYFVEVTDSRGCKFMSSAITVSQPDELVIASVNEIQAVTCYGGSDGSAEVTMEPGTGTPPYTYQWFYNAALSSPVVPEAVSSVLSGVPAGTYYVLVMDNNLCTVTGSVTISQPDQITGSVQLVTPVSCNGESDAVIQVTASGGSGSFEFDLNGEGTWANTDGLFSGLGRGSYTLRVRDANATVCVVNLPDVAITEPAVLTISASVTSNYNGAQISCTSADDGIITVSGSGGTAPYVFNIDGGDFAAGTTFVGLSAGSHTVGIRDARGCTDYTDINISSPDPVTGTASAVSDFNGYNVRCNGGADGVIEVIASGGTGTLRYSRDGTAFQLSNTFTGLTAGLYDITVRDANMCTFLIEDVEVTEPDELTASASVTTDFHGFGVSCFGAADGVVTASATGGAGTYLYRWYYNAALTLAVPGGNADVLSSLPTGTYYVRVTDANGCTASAEVTVTGPPELVITRSADVTLACNGDANGTGSFSVTGGTGVYTIVADVNGTGAVTVPGPSGLTFTGASGGVVSITVTDENDCSKTSSITINEPLPITASAEVTSNYNGSQLSCYGASDGRITVTAMGGTGNLSYVLTSDPSNVTGAESGVFTGLTAGVYNFIVSDVNGCEVPVGPVTITPPPQLEIVVNVISDFNGRDISCYGASDGRAEAVVTGGTGSYTYTWYRDPGLSNPLGQLTPVASNLIAGDYYVRARDINGCTIDGSVTLSQPRALAASVSDQENVDCFSAATGSVTVEANDTTGTAPYYYSIDGGSTWKDDGFFGNLTAMPYTVLVRDANDCVITVPFTITQPSQLVATVTALTHVSCNGGSNGSVTITPSAGSGTAPYRFSLNGEPAVASGVFSGLTAGSYVVTVIDDNDCSIDIPVMISEPPVLELNPTADVTLDCYGDRTGTGTFYAVGGTPNYSFAYDPADNTAGATFAAPGYNTQTIYNAGAGSVTVTVTDSKGCTATATISFTQPDSLTAGSITGDQVLCYGEDPGIISEADAPTGGPAPFDYRFQWQQSNSPTGIFINIPNATGPDYDPNPVNGATTTLYYRRMLTSGSCPPVYSNTVEVLVHPRPIARLRGGGSICPGDTAYLFVEMLAGMGPFTVDINGLTGPLTGYNSGDTIRVMPSATTTYNLLSVTDANMCTSSGPPNISGNATVTVYDLPQITSFTPSPAVCEFEYTTFSATATPAAVIYQWYVIDSTGVRALSDDNTYYGTNMPNLFIFNTTRWMNGNIYYVTASGCGAEDVSAQGVLTVNAAPEITLHPSDTVICLGQSAVMQADATAVQGLEWTWFVNRGSGLEIVHDEAPFSGSTTNTLTITSPPHTVSPWTFRAMARGVCGVPVYTHFASMRVINPPYFISQPASDAICENGSTYFRADARDFNTVNWQVNNGSGWMNLADDINHIGSTSQQLNVLNAPIALDGYRYRLALVSICDTVYSDPVTLTVHTNPVVDFSAIDPLAACGGVPLVIEGNPTGGSGIWSQHRWTGDVGPLNNYFIESPVFNVSITGNYNLTYRVTDSHGCYAEDNLTVIVDSPSALFSQNVDFGCTPLPVTFSKDMSEVAKWWWDFGDGSPLDSINAMPEHIFENSNTGSIEYFRVTLKVQSPGGCFAEYSSMITVYPEINASITPDKDIVCSGNSITFVADQGAKTYYWDFGDGAAGNGQSTMSHRYVNTDTVPVVYTVRLTTTSFYDCVDVAVYDITVMPVPGPQFSADPVMQVYDAAGNDVRFENTSAPGQWNWLWRFGDNTTSTERDPVHTYTDLGTYPVTLVAYNAVCRDSITREIRVVPPQPVAMFEDIPSGCAPWYIKPVNISENIDIPGTKFYWSFGDGSTSTAREPDYTYFTAGDYTVELYIEGPGGTSSYSQRVSAYPSPKAYFEITPERVYVNDERVRCFNLSQGAEWYIWDFGDGDTSKLKEPYHRYMTEGVYDITLWAHSSNGCTDKYILSPAVTVEPVGELRFASVFTPNKTGPVERTDLPTGGVEIDQFFYPSIRERVLEYKLQIFNRWGVLIFESHDINVPWNGYYNNELCPQGVYVWYVEGKYLDGKPFRQAGDVTLLH